MRTEPDANTTTNHARRLLFNGDLWEQRKGAHFTVRVLMLGQVADVTMWARLRIGKAQEAPCVMVDADGNWMFTETELWHLLANQGYTRCPSRRQRGAGGGLCQP